MRKLLSFFLICVFCSELIAKDGNDVVEVAKSYRDHKWKCSITNARVFTNTLHADISNVDGSDRNNATPFPFFPDGVGAVDNSGNVVPAGYLYTGVPYGYGLRDSLEIMGDGGRQLTGGKLLSNLTPNRRPQCLAGGYNVIYDSNLVNNPPYPNYRPPINGEYEMYDYTGIDCSGLVANCYGIPLIVKTNGIAWHPGVGHLANDIFSDPLMWNEIGPGDLIIRPLANKNHVAIAIEPPSANTLNTIDASDNQYLSGNMPRVFNCAYTLKTNANYESCNIERSDGGENYKPRRMSPPYLKKVKLEQITFEDFNKVDKTPADWKTVYAAEWPVTKDSNGIETARGPMSITKTGNIGSGKIRITLFFSKAMTVKYYGQWRKEKISVGLKKNAKDSKFTVEFKPDSVDGWFDPMEVDAGGTVYTKWTGSCELSDEEARKYSDKYFLFVEAHSLMQDKLDRDPETVAKRTSDGKWLSYESKMSEEDQDETNLGGADTNHRIVIVPKEFVLYSGKITATPSGTTTPTVPTPTATVFYLNKVIIKDLHQIPTEESTEIVLLTPCSSATSIETGTITPTVVQTGVPIPTPSPEILNVDIRDYLKGVLYGLVGDADFSDTKYLNGFKALAVAAYTLLLHESYNNSDVDIKVNGYTDSQKYYIPYKTFYGSSKTKDLINLAINDIAKPISQDGNIRYYVKAFWFNKILMSKDDFKRTRVYDKVVIPYLLTNVFGYSTGKNAKNTIIQSSQNVIKQAQSYLHENIVDEADVAVPPDLLNGSKCGMSAWGGYVSKRPKLV